MDQESFQFHTKKVDQVVRRELVNAKKWEKTIDENAQPIRLINITDDMDCDKALLILNHHKAGYRNKNESNYKLKVVQDDLERQLSKLDDLAVDIFDIFLYKCLLAYRSGKQKVVIYAEDICGLRDLKTRGNSFETKSKKIIEERILPLTNLHIQVDGYTIWSKDKTGKTRKTIANYKSPMFLISGFKEEKLFSDDNKQIVEHRYAWEVTLGALFSAIAESLSKPQYLYMPTKVLAYDPKYFANVKRLAKAIYYYFRVKIDSYMKGYKKTDMFGEQVPLLLISIESILKTAGIPLPPAKKRLAFKKSFDKWLSKLEEDGVIKTYEYQDESHLSEGAWFDTWLGSNISIFAPDDVLNLYSHNKDHKKALQRGAKRSSNLEDKFIDESVVDDIISQMRVFREKKALSLRELASMINIAPSTVSMLLGGQRTPSKKLSARIKQALLD